MPLTVAASNAQKSDTAASSTFTFDSSAVLANDLVIMALQWHHDFDVITASPTVDAVHHNSAGISGVAGLWQYIASVKATGAAPTLTFTFGSGTPYYAQMIAIRGGGVVFSTAESSAAWAGNTPSFPDIAYSDGQILLGLICGYDPASIPSVSTEPTSFTRVLLTNTAAITFDGEMVESTSRTMSGSGTIAGETWATANNASPNAYRMSMRISQLAVAGDPPTPVPPMIHGRGAA